MSAYGAVNLRDLWSEVTSLTGPPKVTSSKYPRLSSACKADNVGCTVLQDRRQPIGSQSDGHHSGKIRMLQKIQKIRLDACRLAVCIKLRDSVTNWPEHLTPVYAIEGIREVNLHHQIESFEVPIRAEWTAACIRSSGHIQLHLID